MGNTTFGAGILTSEEVAHLLALQKTQSWLIFQGHLWVYLYLLPPLIIFWLDDIIRWRTIKTKYFIS